MTDAWIHFNSNADRAKSLVGLYEAHKALFAPVVNSDDILRAALVSIVSAMDAYVHHRCRSGLIDAFEGKVTGAKGFKQFQLGAGWFKAYISSGQQTSVLESAIQEKLGWQSFQMPEKIADAWRLISDIQLWDTLSASLKIASKDLKSALILIVDRRNSIVHEGDMRPDIIGELWPIASKQVTDNINFIIKLVTELEKL